MTLERRLPYDVKSGTNKVTVNALPAALYEAGVEGLTFSFAWSLYNGHHLEKGLNALFLKNAADSWVRDVRTVNADSSVLINGCMQVGGQPGGQLGAAVHVRACALRPAWPASGSLQTRAAAPAHQGGRPPARST